ncbi:MAG: ABC transporter permease [Bacteroidota bacterium]
MTKNYLLTALRFFRRQRGYTLLNVLGLTVGLLGAFLILLWVQDELRQDRFHEDSDHLFMAMRHLTYTNGTVETTRSVTYPAAAALEEAYAEIEHAEMVTFPNEAILSQGDRAFRERGYWAEEAFFELFSFPLVAGDPATALDAPDGLVISETLAQSLFQTDDVASVLGRTVRFDDRHDARVTGVAATVPSQSRLQFDWVLPFEEYYARNAWLDHWGNNGARLYVRLAEGADLATVNDQVRDLITRNANVEGTNLFLYPFADYHLYGTFEDGEQAGGRIEYVQAFGVVAFLLVLIACINFMNLATARAAQRAREISVRKTLGATRSGLAAQFLGEAVLVAVGAAVLALVALVSLLPVFGEVAGKPFELGALGPGMWALFVAVAIGAGLLAGSYPAFVLSNYKLAGVLRGNGGVASGGLLRKVLVVGQFAASVLLIVGTLVVYRQIDYIQTKNLGLDRENVVMMTLEGGARTQYDAFRQALLAQPGIETVTTTNQNPLSVGNSTSDPTWDGKDPEAQLNFYIIQASYDFVETMRMEVASGRAFSRAFGADTSNFVVNEAMARLMETDDPVGERLAFWGRDGEIVGMVEDFHMTSLYAPIEPTILLLDTDLDANIAQTRMLALRVAPGQTAEALTGLERTFAQFSPGVPFDYAFLDERFGRMYESEQRIGTLANLFALVAAFVAGLGLFGLAAYAAERRRKEVGVRKVLGASVPDVVALLSREFVALVGVACAVAFPLAYLGAERWLDGFAYRAELGLTPFLIAGASALLLAALTVGVQAYRAATADPIHALRHD